ncbi:hypothetical protein ABZV77_15955 [Streptomyces sp. NPDC004732]|uniref:hypothetical protein n=1 Tax=Streptomyces sp. NPDC004732 TaxID=3154290 RepID=UPI0033B99972
MGTAIRRRKVLGVFVPVWGPGPCRNAQCEACVVEADEDAAAGARGGGSGSGRAMRSRSRNDKRHAQPGGERHAPPSGDGHAPPGGESK